MPSRFSTTDQARIVRALSLERDQRLPGSRVKSLMDLAENYDDQGATGLVDDIRAILTALDDAQELERGEVSEALGPVLSSGTLPEGVSSVNLNGEIGLTFQPGSGPGTSAGRTRSANIQRLRDLLDPDGLLWGVTGGGNILF